jgi:hypothetical protein
LFTFCFFRCRTNQYISAKDFICINHAWDVTNLDFQRKCFNIRSVQTQRKSLGCFATFFLQIFFSFSNFLLAKRIFVQVREPISKQILNYILNKEFTKQILSFYQFFVVRSKFTTENMCSIFASSLALELCNCKFSKFSKKICVI